MLIGVPDLIYVADEISRIIDYDDYTITDDDIFKLLDKVWGPRKFDCFACLIYNDKLARYEWCQRILLRLGFCEKLLIPSRVVGGY